MCLLRIRQRILFARRDVNILMVQLQHKTPVHVSNAEGDLGETGSCTKIFQDFNLLGRENYNHTV